MLLESINTSYKRTFTKINGFLKENYGIHLSDKTDKDTLVKMSCSLKEHNIKLKVNGKDAKSSPVISRNLLMLKGIEVLLAERQIVELPMTPAAYRDIIAWLTDFVVDNTEIGDDFEDACHQGMKEYRSSKWRFPDGEVEDAVRQGALQRLFTNARKGHMNEDCGYGGSGQGLNDILSQDEINGVQVWLITPGSDMEDPVRGKLHDYYSAGGNSPEGDVDDWYADRLVNDFGPTLQVGVAEDVWDKVMDRTGRYKMTPKPEVSDRIKRRSNDWTLSQTDEPTSDEPMSGDEFAASFKKLSGLRRKKQQQMGKKKVSEMKNSFVRRLRTLLESEVDQAEVITAAKGLSRQVQEMIEKIGRLQNEKLPPLSDQVRDTYGVVQAANFQDTTQQSFQQIMDTLYQAKDALDQSVTVLAGQSTDVELDMDADIGGGEIGIDAEGEIGDMGFDNSLDAEIGGSELDSLDAELGEIGDEGGDEFAGEAPLGRETKESVKAMKNRISEMQKLVIRAKKLRETKVK